MIRCKINYILLKKINESIIMERPKIKKKWLNYHGKQKEYIDNIRKDIILVYLNPWKYVIYSNFHLF